MTQPQRSPAPIAARRPNGTSATRMLTAALAVMVTAIVLSSSLSLFPTGRTSSASSSPGSAATAVIPSTRTAAGTNGGCPGTVRGALAAGAAGAARSRLPGSTGPSPLYNSQVTPYAAFTGPYAYVAKGAAMRDQGYGKINLTWPGPTTTKLVAAYMIWSIMNNSVPPSNATLNGVNITGTWTAYATPSPCWSPTYIYTFVADVTNEVVNGVNNLTNFPSGVTTGADPWGGSPQNDLLDDGASLIVIYTTSSPQLHSVTVYSGADTTQGITLSAQLNYSAPNGTLATTTYMVADGQLPSNVAAWNSTVLSTDAFPGSDPKETTNTWSYGNLSDTKTFSVNVTAGVNNTTAEVYPTGGDCLTWIGQVVSVPVAARPGPYNVTFQEQGLASGTTWKITTNGTTSSATVSGGPSSITFSLGNGSYHDNVTPISGYVNPPHGSYKVKGGPVFIRLAFHALVYPVTFNETGLPAYTAWWVDVTNSSQAYTSNQSLSAPTGALDVLSNGTYTYFVGSSTLYHPLVGSGQIVVSGAGVATLVTFVPPPLYNVTFEEQYLLPGTAWGVNVNSNFGAYYSGSTVNRTFELALPNATSPADVVYAFAVSGYAAPGATYFGVDGAPETIFLNYSAEFSVVLNETGLPKNTGWDAYLENATYGASYAYAFSPAGLAYSVRNGSYTFTVNPIYAYQATPSTGPLTVAGAPVNRTIVFSLAPTFPVRFNESGLPAGTPWSVQVSLPNYTVNTYNFTGAASTIQLPNGSYSFEVPELATYAPSPTNGYFSLAGSGTNESIVFTRTYLVTFAESGLPTGYGWYVTLNGNGAASYGPTIVFHAPLGNLSFYVYSEDSFVPTPQSGYVNVTGANLLVPVVFVSPTEPTYGVTFRESGLPAGSNWSVYFAYVDLYALGPAINYTELNGTYYYDVYGPNGYAADPYTGSVTVAGASIVENISFTSPGASYAVTFTESGLPNGATWYINITGQPALAATVEGTDGTTLTTELANGTYAYTAATDNASFTAAGGNFPVSGAAVNVSVPYLSTSVTTYAVAFTESGLPNGATWYVNVSGEPGLLGTVSGSSGTTVTIHLPDGDYTYTAATNEVGWTTSAGGGFTVDGSSLLESVPFSPPASAPRYTVTFNETGLPSGAVWYVNISGQTPLAATVGVGTGISVSIHLVNGTYTFTAATSAKGWTTTAGGGISVNGTPVWKTVAFSARPGATYTVEFTETGLPVGVTWYVNISGGADLSSTVTSDGGTQLATTLANDSYTYTAASNSKNWTAPGGQFTVNGAAVQVTVAFSTPSSSSPSGSSGSFPWIWVAVGIALAALLLFFLIAGRRRKKKQEEGSPGTTAPAAPPPPPSS